MLNLPPSYKEHLREVVEQVGREQQQAAANHASPEASILSSVHSSEYAQDDEEKSFLLITPTMLKSYVFDENRTLVSSIASASLFDDVDGESNNENEDHDGPWYERSTFESNASLMRDDDTRREASTFPTNASAGGILVDTDTDQKDDTTKLKKEEASTAEQTPTGALLQAGTIVAGAIGLGLMLAFGGADRGAATSNNNKKKKKESTKLNRSSSGKQPKDNRRIGWILQDW
jgi:hypothetical protein